MNDACSPPDILQTDSGNGSTVSTGIHFILTTQENLLMSRTHKAVRPDRYVPTTCILIFAILNHSTLAADEHKSPRTYKVAAIQFNPELRKLKKNVDALADRFEQAAKSGAKIIVAPEMATTGYLYLDRSHIADVVETIPGPTTRRFSQIADKHDCYLVWGMPERDPDTDLFYNSSAIVGPNGFLARYRKTHLWESEAHWSSWGNLGVPVFKTRYGRIALLICQDANYVETFRLAALGGADIVCFSTNSSGQTIGHLQARAIQNGLYIISANRSDSEIDGFSGKPFDMEGCSAVWSPHGEKLAEAKQFGEETVYAQVNPAKFKLRLQRLSVRRPETYKDLARHVAPWDYRATTESRAIEAIAVQYRPVPGRVKANQTMVEQVLSKRLSGRNRPADADATHNARLIVLPELSLVGQVSGRAVSELAEDLSDGPTQKWAATIAKRFEAFVVCGVPERDGEHFFNSAIVIDPEGRRIGRARKVHLNQADRKWASPGRGWTVIRNEQLGRLGLLIGTDSYVPETGTIMAIKRADLVAVSASWHGEIAGTGAIAIDPKINPHAKRNAMVLWDEMSWGQQFYTVVANTSATAGKPGGRSGIYSTDPIYEIESRSFAETDGNDVVVGRFHSLNGEHPDHWIDQAHYIGSRRPGSLYYPLVIPSLSENLMKYWEPLRAPRDAVPSVLVP